MEQTLHKSLGMSERKFDTIYETICGWYDNDDGTVPDLLKKINDHKTFSIKEKILMAYIVGAYHSLNDPRHLLGQQLLKVYGV